MKYLCIFVLLYYNDKKKKFLRYCLIVIKSFKVVCLFYDGML